MEITAIRWTTIVLLILGLAAPAFAAQSKGVIMSWGSLLDTLSKDEAMAEARAAFIEKARETAATPIVQRVYALEDVGVKGRRASRSTV